MRFLGRWGTVRFRVSGLSAGFRSGFGFGVSRLGIIVGLGFRGLGVSGFRGPGLGVYEFRGLGV